MKRSLSLLASAALLAWLAPPAGAQSLGEAAAKERERRKNTRPAKVYTDSDVRTGAPSSPADDGTDAAAADQPAAADKAAGEAGAPKDEKSPDDRRAEEATAWRGQIDQLEADLARLDADIARLEAAANDTRGYVYSNRRTVALENLEKARADRAAALQKRDDLLESGRRRGFRAP
jgi:hypothetical protein